VIGLCGADSVVAADDNRAARIELPVVEVIATTPLPGIGLPPEQVPANVQRATGTRMDERQAPDLTDYLERTVDSVTVNAAQNNPFQPDVSFRGFTASPLLGTPQGLSVFVDGVRVNESFGDIVNWDLIPRNAISSMTIIPGSNPVFGLNTLGGALSIQTKSGFQHPGYGLRATAGSFGRQTVEAEYGGHGERADYFVAVNRLSDGGWREHSRSDVQQLFAKTGFQDAATDVDLTLTIADNTLNGTQALPRSMLGNPRQAYTWPDRTRNELAFVSARASHFVSDTVLWSGNAYYRGLRSEGLFSNVNERFDAADVVGPGNSTGFNNVNALDQRSYGGALQLTLLGRLAGRANQFNIGASADMGGTDFVNRQQEARFTSDRGTAGSGPYAATTDVRTHNRYYGLYVADTWSLTQRTLVSLSNRAEISIADRSGLTPALNGDHVFSRFNPAAGVTYNTASGVTAYTGYNRGMRAPTPAELTCSDPGAPCRLPSVFLADPPLKPVLASTWEAGLRGGSAALRWRAAVYRTGLADDIQFVNTARVANAGFFQNVGKTRRQGLELGGEAHTGATSWFVSYAYIDATYRTPFTLASANNSSAIDTDGDGVPDTIGVRPGNRIPGIPRRVLKLRGEHRGTERLTLGVEGLAAAGLYARGDENNADAGGPLGGYAVFNMDARYTVQAGWQLLARVQNLMNRRYETFGVLGTNFFRGPGNTFDATAAAAEQFRSSAAPRGAWLGVSYRYGGKAPR
jgi:iron complex outermembrane recepter protein